jgi:hypothetical protein
MPRGKKSSGRPSAGGIKRSDYHRPNRKENKSTHRTSFGRNVPLETSISPLPNGESRFDVLRRSENERYQLPRLDDLQLGRVAEIEITVIPGISRRELTERAKQWWCVLRGVQWVDGPSQGFTPFSVCTQYARHRLTNYDEVRIGIRGSAYISLVEKVYSAIAETYEWLAPDCEIQIRSVKNLRVVKGRTRIVKSKSLSALHVEEFNNPDSGYEPSGFIGEDDGTFAAPKTSLASDRLLYLPPFLKRDEIKKRRFGGQVWMNDNWWEWEQEKEMKVPEREQRFNWSW